MPILGGDGGDTAGDTGEPNRAQSITNPKPPRALSIPFLGSRCVESRADPRFAPPPAGIGPPPPGIARPHHLESPPLLLVASSKEVRFRHGIFCRQSSFGWW